MSVKATLEARQTMTGKLAVSGGGSKIELDTTLTQPGKAADAKAVGDALAAIGTGGGLALRDVTDGETFTLDNETTGETTIPVTGISISSSVDSAVVGETVTLTAIVSPYNATNKNVIWTSSNPTFATVAYGVVTALAEGDVVITARTEDGNFTDTYSLSIVAESGGGETELDIPSAKLAAYYDLREDLNESGQIVDLSGNGVNLDVSDDAAVVIADGYISREGSETYAGSMQPAKNDSGITLAGKATAFVTISNYENKTTPLLLFTGVNNTSIVLYSGGVIFYDGQFNNVAANTQIDTSETHHVIAVSWDVDGNEKIYINGVLKSDMAVKNVPLSGRIGLLSGYSSGSSVNIRLHNAAIYSAVLDDQTIATVSATLKTNAGGVA